MKLNQGTNDVLTFGEDTSKRAGISGRKLSKLQYLLTKGLYKDPTSATIVEWTNNGIDGIVQAGKSPIDNPVLVTIGTDKDNKMFLSVKDTGVGLDKSDFEDVCMQYLESTKEDDDDTIGHFGLGMKSFLSLERPATFTCIKNGVKRRWLVWEGEEFVDYDMILEEDSTEESGVECKIFINDWTEKNLFVSKARTKLAYYDTAVLIIDGVIQQNSIKRTPLFQWSSQNTIQEMHLCLKDVVYAIDWEALGISRIDMPIALRFGLDSGMIPTPSRESYITNAATKALILKRIQEVSDYMVTKYNDTLKDEVPFLEALPNIGNINKNVTLDDKKFLINELLAYATIPPEEMKIKGLKHKPGSYYKSLIYNMNMRYNVVAQVKGDWNTKKIYNNPIDLLSRGIQVIRVNEVLVGRVKSYLKDKYKQYLTMFVTIKDESLEKTPASGPYNYRAILNLKHNEKGMWREYIKEYKYIESLYDSLMIEEYNIKDKPEFEQFLKDEEEKMKEFKRLNPTWKNPKSLNKQSGDVTLAISRPALQAKDVVYEKKAYRINDLRKLPHFVIYGFEEDKKWLENLQKKAFGTSSSKRRGGFSRLQTCIIGKREIAKLPITHNFISMTDFLSKGNKQFRQIATAELIADAIENYKNISANLVVNKYLVDIKKEIDELEVYVNNFHLGLDKKEDVYTSIMTVAKEQGMWDMTIMPSLKKVLDNIEVLRFVSFLKAPPVANEEKTKEFNNIVNQFILFNKVHKARFADYELVRNEPVEVINEAVSEDFNVGESALGQIFGDSPHDIIVETQQDILVEEQVITEPEMEMV